MTVVARVRETEEQELAALADEGKRAALLLLHRVRMRLDVREERALAEVLRRIDDAARLPGAPQPFRRVGIDVSRTLVGRLVHAGYHVRSAAPLEVVRPDPSSRAHSDRVLVLGARILLEKEEIPRRFDIVRLVDQVDRAGAGCTAGVAVDQDRQALDLGRILAVEDHLEDAPVRPRSHSPTGPALEPTGGRVRQRPRLTCVGEVDDVVMVAVVGNVPLANAVLY